MGKSPLASERYSSIASFQLLHACQGSRVTLQICVTFACIFTGATQTTALRYVALNLTTIKKARKAKNPNQVRNKFTSNPQQEEGKRSSDKIQHCEEMGGKVQASV